MLAADAVARFTSQLTEAGVDSPRADAMAIVAHAARVSVSELRTGLITGQTLSAEDYAAAEHLAQRRAHREPLQYLTGLAAFRYLELQVGPGVFVPRPETEVVTQVAIDQALRLSATQGVVTVVDLCSGSGAIALSIAHEVATARVTAVELEAEAVTWWERNAQALAPDVQSRLALVHGDATSPSLLEGLTGTVDIVVSNPPYVPPHEAPTQAEAQSDPHAALYGGGHDGLDVPRGVMRNAARLLRSGGTFVMEHSSSQGETVRREFAAVGAFDEAVTLPDMAGLDRMTVARKLT